MIEGWLLPAVRCYVPQKLLEESGEPPPVPRIAKEARPRPPPDAGRAFWRHSV